MSYYNVNLNEGFEPYSLQFYGEIRSEYRVDGYVVCEGLIRMTKGYTYEMVVGTVAEDCLPSHRRVFNVVSSSGTIRVDIYPDGSIVLKGDPQGWFTLDGIVYNTEAKG